MHNKCMGLYGILPSIICKCDSIFSIHVRSDIGKHLPFSLVAGYEEFTPIKAFRGNLVLLQNEDKLSHGLRC